MSTEELLSAHRDDDPTSLAQMARDSHEMMLAADLACKAHAALRNAALVRLHTVYGLSYDEIHDQTGISATTARNAVMRAGGWHQRRTTR